MRSVACVPPMGLMLRRGHSAAGPKSLGSSRLTRTCTSWLENEGPRRNSTPGPAPGTDSCPAGTRGPGCSGEIDELVVVNTSCCGVSS